MLPRGESSTGQVRRITGGPKKTSKIDLRKSNRCHRRRWWWRASVTRAGKVRGITSVDYVVLGRHTRAADAQKTNGKSCSIPGPPCDRRRFAAVHHAAAAARKSDHVGNGATRVRVVEFFRRNFH